MAKATTKTKSTSKDKATKTATGTKKAGSKLVKRADKVAKKAVKSASKIKVRGGEEKKTKVKKGEGSRKKFHAVGHAPQSARITSARGPMKAVSGKTAMAPAVNEERAWLLIDAAGQTVGRLASEVAMLLRGKHKTSFTPHSDAGDFVVVINAEKVFFSRGKEEVKTYYKHSGWIGGMKMTTPAKLRNTHPERILESAVKGMISRTPLGRDMMKKLKVYKGTEHPHKAQNPVVWQLRHSARTGN
ncbi:MAG: 50S ribosomal protein L13 [Bdellovibrionota bacterium]